MKDKRMKNEVQTITFAKAIPDPHTVELMMLCDPYFVCYPNEDEEGFDGIHDGGVKGVRDDAPEVVKKAYAELKAFWEENERLGIKV